MTRTELQKTGGAAATVAHANDSRALTPRVDVIEDERGITLLADLPGVSREQLEIKVDGETLTIEGEMNLAMPQGMEATHAEVSVPRFRRTFSLSKELDTDKLQAELKQGVLKLRIQKAEHAKPRKIAVQDG